MVKESLEDAKKLEGYEKENGGIGKIFMNDITKAKWCEMKKPMDERQSKITNLVQVFFSLLQTIEYSSKQNSTVRKSLSLLENR